MNFFARMTKYLAYFLAVIIVIAATMVSIGRLLTPYLNEHRAQFQTFASELLHAPIEIGHVHISWNVYVPELTFEKVTVLDKETAKPAFEIDYVKINLSIFKSLIQRKPVLSYIKVAGLDVTVHEEIKGQMNIVGFGNFSISDNLTGAQREANTVLAWILSQPALVLDDIDIKFIPLAGKDRHLTLYKLSLRNSKNHHVLKGHATLHQDIPTSVTFALSTNGDISDFSKINLHAYLYFEGVILPQWFSDQTWHDLKVKQGLASAKIWADWNRGAWQKVQTQFQIYELELFSKVTKKTQFITRLSGHVGWRIEGDQQIIAGEDIFMDLPEHLWPSSRFYVKMPKDLQTPGDISLQLGYIDLHDVLDALIGSDFLSTETEKKILSLNPNGEIHDLNMQIKDRENWLNNPISAEFINLSLNSFEQFPGIKNLTGEVHWDGKKGDFFLNSQNTQIEYQKLFAKPLNFSEINGKVMMQKNADQTLEVKGNNIRIKNNDLDLNTRFTFIQPQNDSPIVDVESQFSMKDTSRIDDYLALKTFEPELNAWIKQAFHQGKITDAKLILQGQLKDFPFKENNGKFFLKLNIDDLHFNYAPGWPAILHTKGEITFAGPSLQIDIASGQILDVPIEKVHGEIPYIGPEEPQILTITAPSTRGDLSQGLQLIMNSPLEEKLGKELSSLKMSGPMDLNLALQIPLKKPHETKVQGEIKSSAALVQLADADLSIDHVAGTFYFTEDELRADALQAVFAGFPMTINIATVNQSIKINAQSQLNASLLYRMIPYEPLPKILQGTTGFLAEVVIPQKGANKITLRSDLKGMTVNLPGIFNKKAEDATDFIATAETPEGLPMKTTMVFGKILSTAITFKKNVEGYQFVGGEIRFNGNSTANIQTQPGFFISGQFDTLDWDVLQSYIPDHPKDNSNSLLKYLRAMDIRANKILGFSQKLTNARVQMAKSPQQLSVNVNSAELQGQFIIPDVKSVPIKVNLQYLYLSPVAGTSNKNESFNPKILPPISFVGNEVRYGGKSFGRVAFNVQPSANGLQIKSLRADSPIYHVDASGEWLRDRTRLQGNLTTKDIAKLLKHFNDTSSSLVGSDGKATFDLRWDDEPFNPSIATMSGNASIKLGAGRIINLDKSTNAKMGLGRLLNILSVESLTRRLSLNFSDLTQSGFNFDSMTGDFNLKNGNAYTENALVAGNVARIQLKGRIGLAAKDYNMQMSVTPHVTGSLPVVAAIAVNPLVGLAAWAVEKIASNAVGSAATHRYTVTGTWDNPVWKEK